MGATGISGVLVDGVFPRRGKETFQRLMKPRLPSLKQGFWKALGSDYPVRGNEALFADLELFDDLLVTLDGAVLQVIQKTAALGHHLEKAAA